MENRVITIERKFGANGHALAKKFAEEMGIPLYDEELVDLAMEKSGLDHDKIEKASEKQPSRFIFRTSDIGREPNSKTKLFKIKHILFVAIIVTNSSNDIQKICFSDLIHSNFFNLIS
ncbi:MAG: cytidylate kinase family protein [Lachnospiraceae bacterium]